MKKTMNELGQKTENVILIWQWFDKGHTKLVRILILGLLFIKILHPESSFADAEKIFKENNGAVVVIIAYDSERRPIVQGSGFAVRQDGLLVTSYHVINKSTDIEVKVQNPFVISKPLKSLLKLKESGIGDTDDTPRRFVTESLKVEGLIYVDKDNDLAILKVRFSDPPSTDSRWVPVSQPLEKFTAVKLGDIDKVNIGEKIYVISSPQGFENTISEGILSGLRDFRWERPALLPPIAIPRFEVGEPWEATWLKTLRWERKSKYRGKILQFTAPISLGSSGGPVFNKNGEVIGIVTFLVKGEQNLNFAMPVNLIKEEIDNKEVISLKEFQKQFERE